MYSQRYAYDFFIINDNESTHLESREILSNYYCYRQDVLAPADGVVVLMKDNYEDTPIGEVGTADCAASDVRAYLIRVTLGLSAEHYGITEGFLGAAGILGGIAAGIAGTKITTKKLYSLMILMGICLIPVSLTFLFNAPAFISYLLITIAFLANQLLYCMLSILILSVIQQKTPIHLSGKIMAYVSTIVMCSQPIGQAVYGVLFDGFKSNVYVLLIATAIMIVVIGLFSKKTFYNLDK